MPRWLALAFYLLVSSLANVVVAGVAPRYSGQPLMRVFTERETGGAPRNHAVAVHPSGVVYVANDVGLREFDGVTWRVIPGTERRMIFGVAIDAAGRIFCCGSGYLGMLVVEPNGSLTAKSLHQDVPEPDRDFGDVRQVIAVGDEVYFNLAARGTLVRVDGRGVVQVVKAPETPMALLRWEGAIYGIAGAAVYRVEHGAVTKADNAPRWLMAAERSRDVTAWPGKDGDVWILGGGGLRLGRPNGPAVLCEDVNGMLAGDIGASGQPLGDGTFALGTRAHGVLIVSREGRVLARYNEDNGLGQGAGYVEGLTRDSDGGLWVAHDGGVTRVDVDGPGALHGAATGLRGRLVTAMALHRGRFYAGTPQGVFVREGDSGRFTPVKGAPANVNALLSTEEGLLAFGGRLVLLRDDGTSDVVDAATQSSSALRLPRDPERIVAGTANGLRVYRQTGGRWQPEGSVAGTRDRWSQLVQDGAGWLWAVRDPSRVVVRVDWRQGMRLDAPVEALGAAQGLPPYAETQAPVQLVGMAGEVMAFSPTGQLRHDQASDRFVPDNRIDGLVTTDGPLSFFALGEDEFLYIRPNGPPRFGLAKPTGAGAWRMAWEPFSGVEATAPRVALYDREARTLWLGGQQLVSYDLARPRVEYRMPVARVRRVTTIDQKDLWGGAGSPSGLALRPEQNGLNFSFAASGAKTNARGQVLLGYRTRLEGFDADWSAWGVGTTRTYTNLPPGEFTFCVQASGEDYRRGPESTFRFRVIAPWWRTWWFFGIAGVTGIGGVASVARWLGNRALRQRLERLEAQSAVERERLRLARDLHDEVGSGLGRVILFAGEAGRNKNDAVKLDAALGRVRASAQELMQHAREIVWAVSPQHDTLASLVERLGDYVGDTLRTAGIACTVEMPAAGDIPARMFAAEARHSLFLAVKEAVHNCVKYSEAKRAEFRLELTEQHLTLTLRDEGRGFAAGELRGTGHGLVSLRTRAEALGGTTTITSEPGRGTTVQLRVPWQKGTP